MAALLLVAVLGGAVACCSVKQLRVSPNGDVDEQGSGCAMDPLESFADSAAWRGGRPVWLSFAGDSQLRIEFWRLVAMLGRDQYTVTPNFAKIAFNISAAGSQQLVKKDQDPVTVEAKYMDYRFCCRRCVAAVPSLRLRLRGARGLLEHLPAHVVLRMPVGGQTGRSCVVRDSNRRRQHHAHPRWLPSRQLLGGELR
jgi:hypothetical protein